MRYRLRTLLISISLLGVICAAAGWTWRRNLAEQQAVQTLALHRARFDYSDGIRLGRWTSGWTRESVANPARTLVPIHLDNYEANDPEVVLAIRRLPGLKRVNVDCWAGHLEVGEKLRSDLNNPAVEVHVERAIW